MSSPLPQNIAAYAASAYFTTDRKAIIIATISIFSVFFAVHTPLFFLQKRREIGQASPLTYARLFARDLVTLFLAMRISGNAVYLVAEHSSNAENLLIGAAILSGIGTTPLLGEMGRFVLRCFNDENRSEKNGPHKKAWIVSKISLGLVLITIVLSSVGQSIKNYSLTRAGTVLIVVLYFVLLVSSVSTFISYKFNPSRIQKAFMISLAVFPFLGVRVVYAILGGFAVDNGKFSSFSGNVHIAAGMQLAMEVIVITIYMAARVVLIPIGKRGDEEIAEERERFQVKETSETR